MVKHGRKDSLTKKALDRAEMWFSWGSGTTDLISPSLLSLQEPGIEKLESKQYLGAAYNLNRT